LVPAAAFAQFAGIRTHLTASNQPLNWKSVLSLGSKPSAGILNHITAMSAVLAAQTQVECYYSFHEPSVHRSHCDARFRPAGICGRIRGNLSLDVDGLPNHRNFALGCGSRLMLSKRPTLDELLPRSLHGDCCRRGHGTTESIELAWACNAAPTIPVDAFFLSRRIAAHSPAHSLKPLEFRFNNGNGDVGSRSVAAFGFRRHLRLDQALESRHVSFFRGRPGAMAAL